MSIDAFATPSFGPLGIVDNNEVIFIEKILYLKKF